MEAVQSCSMQPCSMTDEDEGEPDVPCSASSSRCTSPTGSTGPSGDDSSNVLSTSQEVALNDNFVEELRKENVYETTDELQLRRRVIQELDVFIKQWLMEVAWREGFGDAVDMWTVGALYPFGSYSLGVSGPTGDIDILLIATRYFESADFFDGRNSLLTALEMHTAVTELTAIPGARVPILKFCFLGVKVDLLFAVLSHSEIDPDPAVFNVLDDENFQGVDEQTALGLNGPRNAEKILQSVPNVETFRTVLRCIKLWAKRRKVYGVIYGYPGGIAWALMVARACQLFPSALPAAIVAKFFEFCVQWEWPKPVVIDDIVDLSHEYGFEVWDTERYFHIRRDLLPVITPCYPARNVTYTVSRSTMEVLHAEWARAQLLCEKILPGQKPWNELWEDTDFFTRYPSYLEVSVVVTDEPDFLFWKGFVESKLQRLVLRLEQVHSLTICLYPGCFCNPNPQVCDDDPEGWNEAIWFYGLSYKKEVKMDLLERYLDGWVDLVYHHAEQNGFTCTEAMGEPQFCLLKRDELPDFTLADVVVVEQSPPVLQATDASDGAHSTLQGNSHRQPSVSADTSFPQDGLAAMTASPRKESIFDVSDEISYQSDVPDKMEFKLPRVMAHNLSSQTTLQETMPSEIIMLEDCSCSAPANEQRDDISQSAPLNVSKSPQVQTDVQLHSVEVEQVIGTQERRPDPDSDGGRPEERPSNRHSPISQFGCGAARLRTATLIWALGGGVSQGDGASRPAESTPQRRLREARQAASKQTEEITQMGSADAAALPESVPTLDVVVMENLWPLRRVDYNAHCFGLCPGPSHWTITLSPTKVLWLCLSMLRANQCCGGSHWRGTLSPLTSKPRSCCNYSSVVP
eukprot:EG_transcript_1214